MQQARRCGQSNRNSRDLLRCHRWCGFFVFQIGSHAEMYCLSDPRPHSCEQLHSVSFSSVKSTSRFDGSTLLRAVSTDLRSTLYYWYWYSHVWATYNSTVDIEQLSRIQTHSNSNSISIHDHGHRHPLVCSVLRFTHDSLDLRDQRPLSQDQIISILGQYVIEKLLLIAVSLWTWRW